MHVCIATTSRITMGVGSSSLAKERPSPTFGPIYCKGSKFAPISAHPGVNFTRLTECTRGI